MSENLKTGKKGEDIACKYLIEKKYKILKRNYREKFDEIDIIAKSYEGILIFCEVKTLNIFNESFQKIMPEDNLTKNKLYKITRASALFATKHNHLIIEDKGWQIDLIAIVLNGDNILRITHYENI